jgi:molybdopterin converting factor small subunit
MRVTVQLFARLGDLAGRREETYDLAPGARAADVWDAVATAHPDVRTLAGAVSCAINADFAPLSAEVRDGDEIAFLPPVSGGAGPDGRRPRR